MPEKRVALIAGARRDSGTRPRCLHAGARTGYIGVRDAERKRVAADELGVAHVRPGIGRWRAH